jgi:hypothetical protein
LMGDTCEKAKKGERRRVRSNFIYLFIMPVDRDKLPKWLSISMWIFLICQIAAFIYFMFLYRG